MKKISSKVQMKISQFARVCVLALVQCLQTHLCSPFFPLHPPPQESLAMFSPTSFSAFGCTNADVSDEALGLPIRAHCPTARGTRRLVR